MRAFSVYRRKQSGSKVEANADKLSLLEETANIERVKRNRRIESHCTFLCALTFTLTDKTRSEGGRGKTNLDDAESKER
jgi:hypothetical protein